VENCIAMGIFARDFNTPFEKNNCFLKYMDALNAVTATVVCKQDQGRNSMPGKILDKEVRTDERSSMADDMF
jgi:hypothetical protein